MDNYKEKNFEESIQKDLIKNGCYAIADETGYDSKRGYKPQALLDFIGTTQHDNWQKLYSIKGENTENYFLDKVEDNIEEFGLLETLRRGIKLNGMKFNLIYFKPETDINEDNVRLYELNDMGCVRQLHYSSDPNNNNSVDMALFVNGFPLAILELKNQFTGQDVNNAVRQFREDRDCNEPIFKFNERCLVYFAVDLYECKMTTKLANEHTYFLPFNQGSNGAGNVGGAGNPENPNGFVTDYLWKKVLDKDDFLEIIQKYLHVEYDSKKETWKQGKMIFPRYHQLDVVTKLVADVKKNGAGKSYLVEHSAGSGKSNSIAWLSYRLSSLHDNNDNKIFDSVIVVTDRRVLDSQLQDTIYQFDHVNGTVAKIEHGSEELKKAINEGKKIIITTLQKFPYIYKDINSNGKKFAVVIDEAHSSQTGRSAAKLKEGLGDLNKVLEEYARREAQSEKNTPDVDDKIMNEIAAQGSHDNLSFFAFTATPKPRTLQLFGTKQKDGSYKPFHIYSMRQAIEEHFILDVLQNYMTYQMYYKIVKKTTDDPKVQPTYGARVIARYESLHPYNLSQKAAIMIEHFMENTRYKICGKAKAMVVTSSRLHAVRYLKEFRKYIKEHNINDIDVLVAFSGDVKDPIDGETYSEKELNVDYKGNGEHIKENQLPKRFNADYNVLIVADKYQTGFDEPLLHTMFVDKLLSGVKAVQTLSRLNRTYPGKVDTFVLDFVNKPEDIQAAFEPYYNGTILTHGADENSIYDIYKRVESYRVINDNDVEELAKVYNNSEDMAKVQYYLSPARLNYIELPDDKQKEFKSILQAFLRNYAFITQVTRMMDLDMQKKYIYCKFLNTILPKGAIVTNDKIDDKIELEYYRLVKKTEGSISLRKDNNTLDPAKGKIGKLELEEKDTLSNIINKVNEKYHYNFTHADKVWEQITKDFEDDSEMVKYAQNNTKEDFKKVYEGEFPKKVFNRFEQNNEMYNKIMSEKGVMDEFMTQMFGYIYERLKDKK